MEPTPIINIADNADTTSGEIISSLEVYRDQVTLAIQTLEYIAQNFPSDPMGILAPKSLIEVYGSTHLGSGSSSVYRTYGMSGAMDIWAEEYYHLCELYIEVLRHFNTNVTAMLALDKQMAVS